MLEVLHCILPLTATLPETAFDFRPFETHLLQEWEKVFLRGEIGLRNYAFFPNDTVSSLLGSADVAYVYYATGLLGRLGATDVSAWATAIRTYQNSTGDHWFSSRPGPASYHYLPAAVELWSAAAEAVEVLFLLGSRPAWPLLALDRLQAGTGSPADVRRWESFMEGFISNSDNVWRDAAAVQAPVGIAEMLKTSNPAFVQWYFQWLDKHADVSDGFWYNWNHTVSGQNAMAAAFHMLHNYECVRKRWPNPKAEVDATLKLQLDSGLWGGEPSTCLDLDGVYTVIRAAEQAGRYKWDEARDMCHKYLAWATKHLNDRSYILTAYTANTHLLHGPLFAIAECQHAFPDLNITTVRPWQRSRDACIYATFAKRIVI